MKKSKIIFMRVLSFLIIFSILSSCMGGNSFSEVVYAACSHTYPSEWTYPLMNGAWTDESTRYKNCTNCGERYTQYRVIISVDTGFEESTRTENWYDAGSTVTVNVPLTPSYGYSWYRWRVYDACYDERDSVMPEFPDADIVNNSYYVYEKAFKITNLNDGYLIYANTHKESVTVDMKSIYGGFLGTMTINLSDQVKRFCHSNTGATGTLYNNTNQQYVRYNKVGYKLGWSHTQYGDSVEYDIYGYVDDDWVKTYSSQSPITLYMVSVPISYKINYNANGGSGTMNSSTHVYDTAKNLPENEFKKAGYTFGGWNTKADGSGTSYSDGASVKNLSATDGEIITLYAQWERTPYLVTYDANGGKTTAISKTFYYQDEIDLSPIAEKEGGIFIGWSENPNGRMPLSSLKMPDLSISENPEHTDGELTLYAVYSIPVSDVANHTYPDYTPEKEQEVFLRVWEYGNEDNYRDYPLSYTSDTNTMVYRYTLDVDISDFAGNNQNAYGYAVYALDNAGNWSVILEDIIVPPGEVEPTPQPTPSPKPEEYLQTVNHYRYDMILKDWMKFDTTTEMVEAGKTYTPAHITPPTGYEKTDITYPEGYEIDDGTYVVKEAATSSAYYEPIDYTLSFDANGGNCSVTQKTISYGDYYGDMPTPTQKGHTFTGWYTEKTGGSLVSSSHKYLTAGNITLYAHWRVNTYTVTYDYWTNGGTSVTTAQKDFSYGSNIDFTATADKSGSGLNDWEFMGWNTDPNATTTLSSYVIEDHDVTLYAIYKKDITVTIVERNDTSTISRNLSKSIYNNETNASFIMEEVNRYPGWTLLGWTTETGATEEPVVGIGGSFVTSDDITLYALYTSGVTLRYDTNGSSMTIEDQSKERFYNASGDCKDPTFTLAKIPVFKGHSFVKWEAGDGMSYAPGATVTISKDIILKAIWDQFPELEVYNRYFTLDEAKNGKITQEELLKKVIGTDKEDGVLVNGTDVIVKDFNASAFTSLTTDKAVEITYQATDSFGNTVEKTIMVTVTDTSMKKSSKKSYVRFISSKFFADNAGNLVSANQGGLEETSIWRTNDSYRNLLQETLSNNKTNVEIWIFTAKDLQSVKEYNGIYGHVINALDKFYELFWSCKQN